MTVHTYIASSAREAAFLDNLARLARVPVRTGSRVLMPVASNETASDRARRTCIDGGRSLMLTCHVRNNDGKTTLAVAVAESELPAPNTRCWRRFRLGGEGETSKTLIFGQPSKEDWELARALVPGSVTLGERMTQLRTRGTVYLASQNEPGTGRDWMSIALLRTSPPRETLAALELPRLWASLKDSVSTLTGRAVSETTRPWSVALSPPTQKHKSAIRLGTTLWARLPETSDKANLFAEQIDALGGPGARMAGVYDYVSRQMPTPRGIGVAAEFDFDIAKQTFIGAHYTLRVPALLTALETDYG